MSYLGSYNIDDVMVFYCNTQVFATGVATDADSVPTYRIYEQETGTAILNGSMALLDSANTAGLYSESITLSAANGFEIGKNYAVYIAATVSSVAGAMHHTLQMGAGVNAVLVGGDTPVGTADIENAIWDSARADHTTSGSFGNGVASVQGDVTGNLVGDVQGDVYDLSTTTYAEPGQGTPAATTTLAAKVNYLYKFMRNKLTNDGTTIKVYADDTTTVDQKAAVSSVAGTVTRGEFATGP